ncbi:MAG: GNAT family N-acetyltransferase [Deltaproteobacteria bacterium]|nr:MAG: GNAT family N-acetyltransferase [Deltaproteobacteria bacterium]
MLDLSGRGATLLSRYMAAYAGNQMQAPAVAGPKKALVPSLHFRWVQSDSDYNKALGLRGTLRQEQGLGALEAMADPFDKRARILLVVNDGQEIATLRLVYSQPGEGLEIEQYADVGPLALDRANLVEVSALSVQPAYRGADLLASIMHYAMLTAVQSGRRYLLVWCPKEMLPAYERLGCAPTGMVLSAGFEDERPRHVLIADTQKLLHGGASTQAFKQFVGQLQQMGEQGVGGELDAEAQQQTGMLHTMATRLKSLFAPRK